MNQARRRGVFLLVQGIECKLGVVGHGRGLQRYELTAHGILEGVVPIDHAQDVRSQADGHWSLLDTLADIFNESLASSNALVVLAFRQVGW